MTPMDAASVQAAYSRWAKTYDWTFGRLFTRARRRAIQIMDLQAGQVGIEVGVGTGLSLLEFVPGCRVVGVDFSRPMLERAAARQRAGEVECAASLIEGDGTCLPFADCTFDAALAPFVVSATPDPVALLQDMLRVCRPGARLVVLNHFSARNPLLAKLERGASVITSRVLGFHAEFPLEPLFERAEIDIEQVHRATPVGTWYTVTFTRRDE